MASVSKETRSGRTLYRIQFRDANKRRKSIRLGGLAKKDAHAICSKVGALVSASISKRPLDNAVAQWLTEIGDELHKKLATAGLTAPRQSATLGDFVARYIEQRIPESADSTIVNFRQVERLLNKHLGSHSVMRSITEGQADEWRRAVARDYAEATLNKNVKRAKQIFKAALRCRVIDANPFADVRGGSETNDERKFFVERSVIDKAIDCCPDTQWKLIISLARYGGLRTPSETLRLKWSDIDWAGDKFTVTSPKTKRYGKGTRIVPLFPELRQYLADAFDNAQPGDEYVITRYRDTNSNLRTQFERILRKASVQAWPRLFQNLRASLETELVNDFPLHVVTAWLGNSPAVATGHYLQVLDEHFQRAAQGGAGGGALSGEKVAQGAAQPSATNGNELSIPLISKGKKVGSVDNPDTDNIVSAPPVGLEPTTRRLTAACSTN